MAGSSGSRFRGMANPFRRHRVGMTSLLLSVIAAAIIVPMAAFGQQGGPEPGGPVPASATSSLDSLALTFASQNGDASPTGISAAVSTGDAALSLVTPGDTVPGGNETVYVIVITGNFTGYAAKVPSGAALPTGDTLAATVDPTTFQIEDWSLGTASIPLAQLGPVTSLPLVASSN